MSTSSNSHPEQTRSSSDWIQAALAAIGVATIEADPQGRVLSMNAVAEALTGWPLSEAVGQQVTTVFRIENEKNREPVADPVAVVLATGAAVGIANHIRLIARDGAEWLLDDSAAPIRNAAGTLIGVVLNFRDVGDRRRAERAMEEARALAEAIVETVREPLVILDANMRVQTANRSFYETFRVYPKETEHRSLFELGNRQWDIPRLRELLEEVLPRDGRINNFEVDHKFEGIGRRVMVLNARRIDSIGLILLAIEDITERNQASEALSLSEIRYRRLFETAQDGILLVDPRTGKVFDSNPFLTKLLDYSHEELVGKELWEIGLFRDVEASKTAFRTLTESGYIRYEDLPLKTRDGRGIEVEFVSNVYDVGEARVIQCNIRDITDRKQAEDALRAARDSLEARVQERTADLGKLNASLTAEIGRREEAEADRRDLQQRLTTAQEDERRRIARELHDQMGQHLTALGLGLKVVKDETPNPSPARDRLQSLQTLTSLIGREIHHLALELRPTALDDLGLGAALANYVEGWSERAGIEADFHATGLEGDRLPAEIETALYRVVQEALTNVLKHAEARRVSVILLRTAGQISAVVEDDGRGFDLDGGSNFPGNRLGMLGMRERCEQVGGSLTVESTPGRGTTIISRVPVNGSVDTRTRI
jgi:PAS domain S-box-containing protein